MYWFIYRLAGSSAPGALWRKGDSQMAVLG
jgi:hypothetical protein